eukprot:992760-Rhodomonas_salina.2
MAGHLDAEARAEPSNILDVGISQQDFPFQGNPNQIVAGNIIQKSDDPSSSEITDCEDEPEAGQLMPISEEQEEQERDRGPTEHEEQEQNHRQTLEVDSTVAIPTSHAAVAQQHSQSVGSFKSVNLQQAAGTVAETSLRHRPPIEATTAPTDVVLHVASQPDAHHAAASALPVQLPAQQHHAPAHPRSDSAAAQCEQPLVAPSQVCGVSARPASSHLHTTTGPSEPRPAPTTTTGSRNASTSGREGEGGRSGGKTRPQSAKDKDSSEGCESRGLPSLKRVEKGKESGKEREKGKDKKAAKAKTKRRDLDQL